MTDTAPPADLSPTRSTKPPGPPFSGWALALATLVSSLANMIIIIDITIANVSIPSIAAEFGASPREGTWIITSYAVADAISVCLTGWLAARFGRARTFIVCLLAFGAISALCSLSSSLGMLVACRVLQGTAGGPILGLSQTLLMSSWPQKRAATGMAIWSAGSTIGPVIGPIIGGYICDHWSWPWIFLINIPIVLIAVAGAARLFLTSDAPPQRRPIDWIGLGLMILWIGALQIVLDRGLDLDWFESNFIVGLSIVAAIGFAAFLIWELTEKNPIVNLRVLRSASFAAGTISVFFYFGAYYGSIILSPLWLQTNMGYTPFWAGVTNAPTGLMVSVTSPLVIWLMSRIDLRVLISTGLVILAGACFWRGHFASNVNLETILINNALIGISLAIYLSAVVSYSMAQIEQQETAAAAGVFAFARTVGIAFSAALITTSWQNATIDSRFGIVDRIHGASAIGQLGAAGIPAGQQLWHLDEMVQNQAVMLATNSTYLIVSAVIMLAAVIVLLAPKTHVRPAH